MSNRIVEALYRVSGVSSLNEAASNDDIFATRLREMNTVKSNIQAILSKDYSMRDLTDIYHLLKSNLESDLYGDNRQVLRRNPNFKDLIKCYEECLRLYKKAAPSESSQCEQEMRHLWYLIARL